MRVARLFSAALLLAAFFPGSAFAWGAKGHVMISRLAAASFPESMPAFLRGAGAVSEIAYLGPEMDRLKGSGQSWDADDDPAHYVDLRDDDTVAGAVRASEMPADREAYDTALRPAGTDQYRQGYLPYEILDGWEQLREDFAYWRVDDYAAVHDSSPVLRAQAARDRAIVQNVTIIDLGVWSHFVGDGSQPLHVSVHYNGWGDFPNPENFTQSRRTHSDFESEFVNRYVGEPQVRALMKPDSALPDPQSLLEQPPVMAAIMRYLDASKSEVPKLYQIEKSGGFATGSPDAVGFAASRLAAGAMAVRDFSRWAWQDSAFSSVGYPEIRVSDVLSGKVSWPQNGGE